MNQPKYREDVKGNLAATKADCLHMMKLAAKRGGDEFGNFYMDAEDSPAWDEYSPYLTEQEMRALWKKASA